MLLPAFTPAVIAELEPITRGMCNEPTDGFIGSGRCDAAADYVSHVPTCVISRMLGVNDGDGDASAPDHDLAATASRMAWCSRACLGKLTPFSGPRSEPVRRAHGRPDRFL